MQGRDKQQWNSRDHPASCAGSSCFEDGSECFQTLIPLRTSPLVFSSSAFSQEDKLKLSGRDKGSEVRANVCSDASDRCKAAFMGISEQLLAAPPEPSSTDAAVPHDVNHRVGFRPKTGEESLCLHNLNKKIAPNRKAFLEPGAGPINTNVFSDGLQMQHCWRSGGKSAASWRDLSLSHLGNEDRTLVCPKTHTFFA